MKSVRFRKTFKLNNITLALDTRVGSRCRTKKAKQFSFWRRSFFVFMNSKYLLHEKNLDKKKLRSPPKESAGPDEVVLQGKL